MRFLFKMGKVEKALILMCENIKINQCEIMISASNEFYFKTHFIEAFS